MTSPTEYKASLELPADTNILITGRSRPRPTSSTRR